jgi:hypothetical protein
MTSSEIFTWSIVVVAALGVGYFVWKLWSDRQADSRYAQLKAGAGTDVQEALQGMTFTVGTPSELNEAGLVGQFGWMSGERAWAT